MLHLGLVSGTDGLGEPRQTVLMDSPVKCGPAGVYKLRCRNNSDSLANLCRIPPVSLGGATRGAASLLRQTNHGSQTSISQPPTSTLGHNYRDQTLGSGGTVTALMDSYVRHTTFQNTHTHIHKKRRIQLQHLENRATLTAVFCRRDTKHATKQPTC